MKLHSAWEIGVFALFLFVPACFPVNVTGEVTAVEPYGPAASPHSRLTIAFTNPSGRPCRLKTYMIEDAPMRFDGDGISLKPGERVERQVESHRISPKMEPKEIRIREIECKGE